MQKTIIACCVGALFAAGTAAAATYTEGDKVGISPSPLKLNKSSQRHRSSAAGGIMWVRSPLRPTSIMQGTRAT